MCVLIRVQGKIKKKQKSTLIIACCKFKLYTSLFLINQPS